MQTGSEELERILWRAFVVAMKGQALGPSASVTESVKLRHAVFQYLRLDDVTSPTVDDTRHALVIVCLSRL